MCRGGEDVEAGLMKRLRKKCKDSSSGAKALLWAKDLMSELKLRPPKIGFFPQAV
jgi:hypothetical protein